MEDIRDFFKETESTFTIYVVEQRFVVGRGADYFRSYKGKINYIDADEIIKNRINGIWGKIAKHIPDIADLIEKCFTPSGYISILDVISSLSKIFSVTEQQAAGPDVIDPIIIQEGKILPKYINRLITLHKSSILRPVIIILLKDNDFVRATKILSGCPHDTQVKMIRNSGETEIFRVINCGSENIDGFLEAFSYQCFSTCSNTKRSLLYNPEWAQNSYIKLYSPTIMQIRSNLIFRDKTLVRADLERLIFQLQSEHGKAKYDQNILLSLECIVRLFRVFCNDGGVQDINRALDIAEELENEILLAHVYRNAYFLDKYTLSEKIELMKKASDIFSKHNMEDHSIYARNNAYVRQFDTDDVSVYDFLSLQEQAIYNVPGLVGMSHILNNTGAAFLTKGDTISAIEYFSKGLDYAYRPERIIQKIALMTNIVIAKRYQYNHIDENELFKIMNMIFFNNEVLNLPFLSARYALDIVAIGYSESIELGKTLLEKYPVKKLIQNSLDNNILGSGQLLLQLSVLAQKYDQPYLSDICSKSYLNVLPVEGIRKHFIEKTGFNPCLFSTWF